MPRENSFGHLVSTTKETPSGEPEPSEPDDKLERNRISPNFARGMDTKQVIAHFEGGAGCRPTPGAGLQRNGRPPLAR